MIRYALYCEHDHPFEAWFGSSSDYDVQAARGQVECPMCLSTVVRKQIMSPAISTSRRREAEPTAMVPALDAKPDGAGGREVASPEAQAQMRTMMMEALSQVRRLSKTPSTTSATASPKKPATSTKAAPSSGASMAKPAPRKSRLY
jgi:hypothetical protein